MTAPVFVDTDVLVHRLDARDGDKQARADEWLTALWETRRGRLSYQVLQEFYVTVTRKLRPGLSAEEGRSAVRALLAWHPLAVDRRVVEGAWLLEDRYSLSWWDALIVSAAQVEGCPILLTEDLQHDQEFDGVRAVSPFRERP